MDGCYVIGRYMKVLIEWDFFLVWVILYNIVINIVYFFKIKYS